MLELFEGHIDAGYWLEAQLGTVNWSTYLWPLHLAYAQ